MYKANKSFSGVINMKKGEVKEIADKALADELVKIGYVENLEKEVKESKPAAKRTTKKKETSKDA